MGAAPMAYVLWTQFLKHNPANPQWFDRDRFVLSPKHGSILLYSLLHLTGYDLPLEQIKQFREWGSMTPGHPERDVTPGVETSTGPLGQGLGNGVGLAMAEAHLAACHNRPGLEIVNHFTYGIVSDGDLMEGVSSEAASLAGHLKLGKLIYLYDDNHVTLSAGTDLTFTEDRARRFEAYGWHVQSVEDGNDLAAIVGALRAARGETDRPSLILVRTHIGYGSPHKQDSFESHGSPLGAEEVQLAKQNLGWPAEPPFYIPEQARTFPRGDRTREINRDGMERQSFSVCQSVSGPGQRISTDQAWRPARWMGQRYSHFPRGRKGHGDPCRRGKVMNAVASRLPALIGGSADLNPSDPYRTFRNGRF